MFFLVYGDDTYRSRKKLAALRGRFSATRDSTGINSCHIRADGSDIDAVAEALFASPFLAEKKLVVLEGFLRAEDDVQERLKGMLGRKPESTVVIFYEDAGTEALGKAPLLPLLAEQKYTEECKALAGPALERQLIDDAKELGAVLSPALARELIAVVGADPWQLHEELAKLCAYAKASGRTAVEPDMLRELVSGAREASLFAFIDACTEGRCADAASMLERLLESGVAELQLVSMLEKQYRTLIATADLVERGVRDKAAVASKLGIHPFPAGKAVVAVRRHSPAALRRWHEELLDIERQMKSGGAKPRTMLSVFIAKLANSQQPTANASHVR